jgi:subtilisin family serine protease
LLLLTLAASGAAPPPDGRIGPGVETALQKGERPRVVIFLEIPPIPPRDLPALREAVARAQERVLSRFGGGEFRVIWKYEAVPSLVGTISAAGLARLRGIPGVVRVDLDEPMHAELAQSVPLIGADQMRLLGHTGEGITIAVMDSGVDTDHPDLADDLDGQACFCTVIGGNGCCPGGDSTQFGAGAAEDGDGHGTHVSGIITSGGTRSPRGVAPDARFVAVRVLDDDGSSCCITDLVAGLNWILNNRPDVDYVNMSLGTLALFSGNCDNATGWTLSLSSAINSLRNNGVLSFAASGNEASGTQMAAPACIANAISVGAVYDATIGGVGYAICSDPTTAADQVTCFSNSNAVTDLFAPGAAITSDYLGGLVATYYGTSQATPHAAGCAATLRQAQPTLTAAEMENLLEGTGVPVTDPKNGRSYPRIDCLAALESLGGCLDRDGDRYGLPGSDACPAGAATDCSDLSPDTYPGAPQLCDGVNNDCDDPSWPFPPAAEADTDGDSYPLCNDCDDDRSTVHPGAAQVCDGINNDCDDPSWPAVPPSEVDADGDTAPACTDCNDASAAVHPGAAQVCDGVNNDCAHPSYPSLAGTNEADDDGDAFSECAGDCNDFDPAVRPGGTQVCDGINNDCSHPFWPFLQGTNEADDDSDSFSECTGDCDDGDGAVHPGAAQICDARNNDCSHPSYPGLAGTNEEDADGDGFSPCQADCDDAQPTIHPGAAQVCDGVNNDCASPGWPSLAGTNEADADLDGFSPCAGDCDETDPTTYSGAGEVNDAQDNQCPSDAGYGLVDEISGEIGFPDPADPDRICWPAQPQATGYEAVRSGGSQFAGSCTAFRSSADCWTDPENPALGGVSSYLVRSTGPHLGSWGRNSAGTERVALCGAEAACDDGQDNDSDGALDCDDPDCFADPLCAPAVFAFLDTTGDDVGSTALEDFFNTHPADAGDFLFFSLGGPGVQDFSICAERADFYRDAYLANAAGSGTATSGGWSRWYLEEGGAVVGPITDPLDNYFGTACLEEYSWCPESGLAGRQVAVLPVQTGDCESLDFSTGCGAGAWTLTIRIGPSRAATCGF